MKNICSFKQSKFAAAPLVLATAFLLAGCMNNAEDLVFNAQPMPYSGSERHPIEVAKGKATMTVATRSGKLQPAQMGAVSGFARQASTGALSPITIARPSAGGPSATVAREIANLLAQQGWSPRNIRSATYSGKATDPVRLSFVRISARTDECGDWSVDATDTNYNQVSPNHGCAIQSNIAAMVANPMDFEAPDPMSPAYASTRTTSNRSLDSATTDSTASAPADAASGG
jgi:pilus assembly protein CpaD